MIDDPNSGWPLVQAAWEEYLSPATCFAYAIGLLHKSPGLWKLVANRLRARQARAAEASGSFAAVPRRHVRANGGLIR
jgi:hypothetical protein